MPKENKYENWMHRVSPGELVILCKGKNGNFFITDQYKVIGFNYEVIKVFTSYEAEKIFDPMTIDEMVEKTVGYI